MNKFPTVASKSSWPTVVGVLCIIYALFGIAANSCNVLWPWAQGPFLSMTGLEGITIPWALASLTIIGGVVGVGLAIVLLVSGVGVLRRRAKGFQLLRLWVIIKIIETTIAFGAGIILMDTNIEYQQSIQDATRDLVRERGGNTGSIPIKTAEEMKRSTIIMTCVMVPFMFAFPVIIGWLCSKKAWQVEVDGWEDQVA